MERMRTFPRDALREAAARPQPENHRVLGAWLEIDEAFHDLLYEMARNSRAR